MLFYTMNPAHNQGTLAHEDEPLTLDADYDASVAPVTPPECPPLYEISFDAEGHGCRRWSEEETLCFLCVS
jgi:hypothetical protein